MDAGRWFWLMVLGLVLVHTAAGSSQQLLTLLGGNDLSLVGVPVKGGLGTTREVALASPAAHVPHSLVHSDGTVYWYDSLEDVLLAASPEGDIVDNTEVIMANVFGEDFASFVDSEDTFFQFAVTPDFVFVPFASDNEIWRVPRQSPFHRPWMTLPDESSTFVVYDPVTDLVWFSTLDGKLYVVDPTSDGSWENVKLVVDVEEEIGASVSKFFVDGTHNSVYGWDARDGHNTVLYHIPTLLQMGWPVLNPNASITEDCISLGDSDFINQLDDEEVQRGGPFTVQNDVFVMMNRNGELLVTAGNASECPSVFHAVDNSTFLQLTRGLTWNDGGGYTEISDLAITVGDFGLERLFLVHEDSVLAVQGDLQSRENVLSSSFGEAFSLSWAPSRRALYFLDDKSQVFAIRQGLRPGSEITPLVFLEEVGALTFVRDDVHGDAIFVVTKGAVYKYLLESEQMMTVFEYDDDDLESPNSIAVDLAHQMFFVGGENGYVVGSWSPENTTSMHFDGSDTIVMYDAGANKVLVALSDEFGVIVQIKALEFNLLEGWDSQEDEIISFPFGEIHELVVDELSGKIVVYSAAPETGKFGILNAPSSPTSRWNAEPSHTISDAEQLPVGVTLDTEHSYMYHIAGTWELGAEFSLQRVNYSTGANQSVVEDLGVLEPQDFMDTSRHDMGGFRLSVAPDGRIMYTSHTTAPDFEVCAINVTDPNFSASLADRTVCWPMSDERPSSLRPSHAIVVEDASSETGKWLFLLAPRVSDRREWVLLKCLFPDDLSPINCTTIWNGEGGEAYTTARMAVTSERVFVLFRDSVYRCPFNELNGNCRELVLIEFNELTDLAVSEDTLGNEILYLAEDNKMEVIYRFEMAATGFSYAQVNVIFEGVGAASSMSLGADDDIWFTTALRVGRIAEGLVETMYEKNVELRSMALILLEDGDTCGNGVRDDGEDCDLDDDPAWMTTGAPCCDLQTCSFFNASHVCRAAGGTCDVVEKCTGLEIVCPNDTVKAEGTVCREADFFNPCDAAELCDGLTAMCPATEWYLPEGSKPDGCDGAGVHCDGNGVCEQLCTAQPDCPSCLSLPHCGWCLSANACNDSRNECLRWFTEDCPARTLSINSTELEIYQIDFSSPPGLMSCVLPTTIRQTLAVIHVMFDGDIYFDTDPLWKVTDTISWARMLGSGIPLVVDLMGSVELRCPHGVFPSEPEPTEELESLWSFPSHWLFPLPPVMEPVALLGVESSCTSENVTCDSKRLAFALVLNETTTLDVGGAFDTISVDTFYPESLLSECTLALKEGAFVDVLGVKLSTTSTSIPGRSAPPDCVFTDFVRQWRTGQTELMDESAKLARSESSSLSNAILRLQGTHTYQGCAQMLGRVDAFTESFTSITC
eukprot:TRINITY_DN3573_c0_g1_i1.p1 TRINITY_DN3573_c0_g1~~TRINITY_DN3573_c0_g1_i1.p1  ORF type:complete len:1381 (-),score=270.16 TRINITY_DN3573_c0_g1_i1:12-4154(-)